MVIRQRLLPSLSFAALAGLVLAVCLGLIQSGVFLRNPMAGAIGLTFDLTVTIPALYYLFLVRPGHAPAISLLPVFLVCVRVAHFVLPPTYHGVLHPLLFVAAPLELVAIGLFIRRVRRIARHQKESTNAADPLERWEQGARSVYGDNRLIDFVMTELSVFYFALLSWRTPVSVPTGATAYTCYQKSGWKGLIGILTFMILLEGSIVHYLLQRWSVPVAWIWTSFDLYAILWLLADYQALRLRPLLLTPEALEVRFGLRWRGTVPREQIRSLRVCRATDRMPHSKEYLKVSLLSDPEFILILREPVEFRGLAGIRRNVRRIGIRVDDPELLVELQRTAAVNTGG